MAPVCLVPWAKDAAATAHIAIIADFAVCFFIKTPLILI
jgi:hypothetical protein